MQYTRHFKDMLKERSISMSMINRALAEPEKTEDHSDGAKHFLRRIPDMATDGCVLLLILPRRPIKLLQPFLTEDSEVSNETES